MNHSDFIVYLHKIPPEGLSLAWEISDCHAAGIDLVVPLEGAVTVDFAVERFDGEIHVAGTVEATLRLECSRCLEPFSLPFRGKVDATFAPRAKEQEEVEESHELSEDDLDVEPLVGGAADLRSLVAEQIHLALPIKPLCSPDCRGLCPQCGRHLSQESCGCASAEADPRWDALRKLTLKG